MPDRIRIAVTGASGFLGHHVLEALSKADAEVVAHVRSHGAGTEGPSQQRVAFDLAEAPDDAFDRLGYPDIVIHLAWGGLPNYLSSRHTEVELPAQRRFLSRLVAAGLDRLVVAGTCLEYGMQSGCLREDMEAQPASAYGLAKATLREQMEAMSEQTPFDLRWLRLFYLYGAGQAPASLYSQFRAAVGRGAKTFDMSKGDQVRDFMKAEDAAAAIVRVALATHAPRLLNVCSGKPTSVKSLVERWRAELASDIKLNLGVFAYPAYEPLSFWGDNTRLAAMSAA